MKQTAVEWLEQEIFRKYKFTLQQLNCQPLEEAIQQAKEMEKQKQGYSEEDMQEYAEFCIRCYEKGLPCIIAEDWFNQFKKK